MNGPSTVYNAGVTQLSEEIAACIGGEKPLTQRAPVTISLTQPNDATGPALQVNAYKNDGTSGDQTIAIDTHGLIYQNGQPVGASGVGVPINSVIMYDGNPADLDPLVWDVFVDVEDRFVIGAGGTFALGDIGGSEDHDHGASTGSNNTSISVSGTNAAIALSVSGSATTNTATGNFNYNGVTGDATVSGTTGSSTTGISIANHSDHNHAVTSQSSPTGGGSFPNFASGTFVHYLVDSSTGLVNDQGTTAKSHSITDPGHTHSFNAGAHNHTLNGTFTGDHNHTVSMTSTGTASVTLTSTGNANHAHGITADSHIPPYYAIWFIKRIA